MTQKTDEPDDPFNSQVDTLVCDFLNSYLPVSALRAQTEHLLSLEILPEVLKKISPEDRESFVLKISLAYLAVNVRDESLLDLFANFYNVVEQLPPPVSLSEGLEKRDDKALTPGFLSDVWRGKYRSTCVSIKIYRAKPARQDILIRRVLTLKKLSYPHITEFHGVATSILPFALVYDWEENGHILHYVQSHPNEPRLPLLLKAALGLTYLHSHEVIHGNLRATNVLVDRFGHVRLTDYGLDFLHVDHNLALAIGQRWLAPEIIDGTNPEPGSKPADIFSFGILSYEVFTGQPPFEGCNGPVLLSHISRGGRPKPPRKARDIGFTRRLQKLLKSCWRQDPARRPTIDQVVGSFKVLLGSGQCQRRSSDDQNHGVPIPDVVTLPIAPPPPPPLGTTGGQPTNPIMHASSSLDTAKPSAVAAPQFVETQRVTPWWRKFSCGLLRTRR